ncbi:GFA family protein [Dongia deserti]|uniref:GFA family protein n=1 Tax=Dongia deserti TaxID=2268030 RepID=UPI000E651BB4|nr:GFA family protein [Dongia deserti]
MMKTYHGSCHCGAVRFECDLDLAKGTSKCNCSACAKGRFWKAIVMADSFRLKQGAEALADYQFGRHVIHHQFCRTCGIKPFGHANVQELGGEFYAVNVACLDDVTPEELAAAPVQYEDGRNDRWDAAPAVTRHL